MSKRASIVMVVGGVTEEAILELGETMRAEDAAECYASAGVSPLQALRQSVAVSVETWTAYLGGGVMAVWGVARFGHSVMGPLVGVVWMLTSCLVDRYPLAFWRECKRQVRRLLQQWDALVNAIDCRHSKALRWAERLGFALEPPAPFGSAGLPFRRFVARRECCHV